MFVPSRVSRFVLLTLTVQLGWTTPARSGSFLMEPGAWQVINYASFMTSGLSYDAGGVLSTADRYRKLETGVWAEYGLTRDVTLIFNPVVRDVGLETQQGALVGHGLSSLEMGARWRLFDYEGQAVSFQATARLPAKSDPILPLENRARTELRLGYGTPAIINGRRGFADWSLSWVKRHEAGADEVTYATTFGWWRTSDRMIMVQHFTTFYPDGGLRRSPRQDKVQVSSVYKLNDKWSLQLGNFFTRGGRLTRRERGSLVAVWRRF